MCYCDRKFWKRFLVYIIYTSHKLIISNCFLVAFSVDMSNWFLVDICECAVNINVSAIVTLIHITFLVCNYFVVCRSATPAYQVLDRRHNMAAGRTSHVAQVRRNRTVRSGLLQGVPVHKRTVRCLCSTGWLAILFITTFDNCRCRNTRVKYHFELTDI